EVLLKRSDALQAEVDSLFAEIKQVEESPGLALLAGSGADSWASRRALKAARRQALKYERRALKEARRQFRHRVEVWQKIDRGSAAGDNGRYDETQDLSLHVLTIQLRQKLEAECIELGISLNELPSPPKSAPRLPAKTTA
ncbi:MAG: hypothetical protein AAB731_04810, partial [Patescibacteria group bacterium]